MKIIMLGAPGAGKGTQAKKLAEKYKIAHISTGDIFRAYMKAGTTLGNEAKIFIDKGLLVPDDIVVELVIERISREDCQDGYVLDGFPRTIPQAIALDNLLESNNDKINYAVNFQVPDENIVKRMSGRRACLACGATYHIEHNPTKTEGICDICGKELVLRDDDKPETVLKRLKVYHDLTRPLIEYYTKKNIIVHVDGTKGLGEVFEDIISLIENK